MQLILSGACWLSMEGSALKRNGSWAISEFMISVNETYLIDDREENVDKSGCNKD